MDRHADPVVGHAALGEVVGPYLRAAVAGRDLAPALLRHLLLLSLPLGLVEPRAQDLHRPELVLVLALLVLAGHDDAGRLVRQAHGGVGRVDALAAGTRAPEHVDVDVVGVDHDVDLFGLGQDRHRRRRRMNPPLRLGHGHTLDPVHPAFELEPAVGAVALDREDDLLETAGGTRVRVHHLDLPLLALGVARVHPVEVRREERGLLAAGPRAYLHDRVLLVVGVPGDQELLDALLERSLLRLELLELGPRELLPLGVVGGLDEHLGLGDVGRDLLVLLERVHDILDARTLLRVLLVEVAVGQHLRSHQKPIELLEPRLYVMELLKHRLTPEANGCCSRFHPRQRQLSPARPQDARSSGLLPPAQPSVTRWRSRLGRRTVASS